MKLIAANMNTTTISYYANFYAGQYQSSKQECGENVQKKRDVLYSKIKEYNKILEQRGLEKVKVQVQNDNKFKKATMGYNFPDKYSGLYGIFNGFMSKIYRIS